MRYKRILIEKLLLIIGIEREIIVYSTRKTEIKISLSLCIYLYLIYYLIKDSYCYFRISDRPPPHSIKLNICLIKKMELKEFRRRCVCNDDDDIFLLLLNPFV